MVPLGPVLLSEFVAFTVNVYTESGYKDAAAYERFVALDNVRIESASGVPYLKVDATEEYVIV